MFSLTKGYELKKNNSYRAVLFDLDGTLLDTLQDIASSANSVLGRFGFPQHEVKAYKYFVGDGTEALCTRMLPHDHCDADTVAKVLAGMVSEYSQHWGDTTCPYKGIPELLQALKERGVKMAVLSNKSDDSTKIMVSSLLSQYHFELVIGARPSLPKKPDPSAALEICRSLNILPGEFIYLGDTATDMKTAQNAGMFPIGAVWGFRTADELLAGGAKTLISNPAELLKILR